MVLVELLYKSNITQEGVLLYYGWDSVVGMRPLAECRRESQP